MGSCSDAHSGLPYVAQGRPGSRQQVEAPLGLVDQERLSSGVRHNPQERAEPYCSSWEDIGRLSLTCGARHCENTGCRLMLFVNTCTFAERLRQWARGGARCLSDPALFHLSPGFSHHPQNSALVPILPQGSSSSLVVHFPVKDEAALSHWVAELHVLGVLQRCGGVR